eukprot:NODE_95_length_21460_cov_0.300220.p3 type:complete len:447 gc:universal NODE_95_length_21460_cov_0.300220:1450-110(-)
MKIAIVGAGFRGLSLGYYIKKLNPSYTISFIEKSNRIGGWIDSEKTKFGIAEKAARTIRSSGEGSWNIAEMCTDLRIIDRVVTLDKDSPAGKNRAIIVNGKVELIPSSLFSLLAPKYIKELLKFIFTATHQSGNSVEQFFLSNFGLNFANLSSALCHGIYASDNSKMSLKYHFPLIANALQVGNDNLIRGLYNLKSFKPEKELLLWKKLSKTSLWGFDDGMNVLTDELGKNLISCDWQMNTRVKKVEHKNNKILLDDKPFDKVYWTCALDKNTFGANAPVAPSQSIYVVNLFYPKTLAYERRFGILNTKQEMATNSKRRDLLGIIFDSEIRSNESSTQFTVMLGGYQFNKYTELEAKKVAHNHVNDLVLHGKAGQPLLSKFTLQKNCIPYYPINGYADILKRKNDLESKHLNKIRFISQDFMGVGMTECARIAKHEAIAISPNKIH